MAVYDGVPSIRLEGDEKRALALIPEAKALLQTVQAFKKRAGVSTFSMSYRVDGDSTIYVLCSGDVNVLSISVAPVVPTEVDEERTEVDAKLFPDFYSGLVFRGYIETDVVYGYDGRKQETATCATFAPTPSCAEFFKELSPGRQDVPRLAVRPHGDFALELSNPSPSGIPEFSQYARLRPSMYSGTMRKVVQVVMGMGRIGKPKMRDPKKEVNDSQYIKDVGESGVQVRYDWRFNRTHGIHTATDGRLWLIEISQTRGVLAMPLPIFPNSDGEGFYTRAENRGDRAMTAVLDELGCLPSGESFPATAAQVDALVARGDILQLLLPEDLEEFYKCSAYSSSSGWAFNSAGTEAHNTGFYFGDDGFQRGVWYQVNVKIGETKPNRKPEEPIAVGTAVMVRNREGYIYCPKGPSRIARFAPIKFFEPMIPGLLSHDGSSDLIQNGATLPVVDTPMFVCFVDDDLKVVSFYSNYTSLPYNNVEDPRYPGECMYAGSWTITQNSGKRGYPTMMYSNDFDDRRELQEWVTVTEITSDDLGFDPPQFSDFIESPESCIVYRRRVFRRTTVVDNQAGEHVQGIVVVPQFSREAYFYAAHSRFNGGRSGSTGVVYDYITDPNTAYGWRCFPRINAPPFPRDRPDCNTQVCRGEGGCTFAGEGVHKERRVVCLVHQPGICSEFADSGEWLQLCEVVDGFNQPGMDAQGSMTYWNNGVDDTTVMKLVSHGHGGPVTVPLSGEDFLEYWTRPSPDPQTAIAQFAYAEHSALGEDALIYSHGILTPTEGKTVLGYTPDTVVGADGYPAFIGVNQP